MARKKAVTTQLKTMPEVDQVWEDSSFSPPSRFSILSQRTDEDREELWGIQRSTLDSDSHPIIGEMRLRDFCVPHIQCVYDPKAPVAAEVAAAMVPDISVVPTKKGFEFVCPGLGCGDSHKMEETVPWPEVVAAHDRFRKRHEDHMAEGTLFGSKL